MYFGIDFNYYGVNIIIMSIGCLPPESCLQLLAAELIKPGWQYIQDAACFCGFSSSNIHVLKCRHFSSIFWNICILKDFIKQHSDLEQT